MNKQNLDFVVGLSLCEMGCRKRINPESIVAELNALAEQIPSHILRTTE